MLTSLGGGRDLRQQRSRAPRPAAHRTSCHAHGGYCTGHHMSALAAGIRLSAGHFVWAAGRRHEPGRRHQPDHACRTPSVRTPSVRTAVVPEAADGQAADRCGSAPHGPQSQPARCVAAGTGRVASARSRCRSAADFGGLRLAAPFDHTVAVPLSFVAASGLGAVVGAFQMPGSGSTGHGRGTGSASRVVELRVHRISNTLPAATPSDRQGPDPARRRGRDDRLQPADLRRPVFAAPQVTSFQSLS
jgi:hypothetical protein